MLVQHDKHYPRKSENHKAQTPSGEQSDLPPPICALQFAEFLRQCVYLNSTQSLLLFPVVSGVSLMFFLFFFLLWKFFKPFECRVFQKTHAENAQFHSKTKQSHKLQTYIAVICKMRMPRWRVTMLVLLPRNTTQFESTKPKQTEKKSSVMIRFVVKGDCWWPAVNA